MADEKLKLPWVSLAKVFGPIVIIGFLAIANMYFTAPTTYAKKDDLAKTKEEVAVNTKSFEHIKDTLDLIQKMQKESTELIQKNIEQRIDDMEQRLQEKIEHFHHE